MATFTYQGGANTWTTTTAWSPNGYPGQNTTADKASFTSAIGGTVTAVSVTIGQIGFNTTTGTTSVTVAASAGQTITLNPSASFAGLGIDVTGTLNSATLSLNAAIALGSPQTWSVYSGNTLNVGGLISGSAKDLTLSGAGVKNITGANTGWTGSTVTLAATSGNQVNVTNINSLGASSNAVVVGSGANVNNTVAMAQTSITINGAGFTGGTGYGAFTTTNALASGQTFTFGSTGTVLSTNAASFAPAISVSAGVTSITLNIVSSSATGVTFTGTNTYNLGVGGKVRIQSLSTNGTTRGTGRFGFGAATTDSGSGLGTNNDVVVETTGAVSYSTANVTLTLSRNYEFLASTSPTNGQIVVQSATTTMDFAGTVNLTGTAGQAVGVTGPNSFAGLTGLKFSGTITGTADLWTGNKLGASSAVQTILGSNLDSSGWSGTLYADGVNYYGGGTSVPTFPLVLVGSSIAYINTIGNASANHSSYSRTTAGTIIFNWTTVGQTGNLTLGGGSFVSSPGTWQTDAGTLTLNFGFTGAGAIIKSGSSTLVLGGNNTGFTGVSWTAGNLTLNATGSAGPAAATFTVTSTGILDNASGSAVTLTQAGANALNANFTWLGASSLTFGAGALTWNATRNITFSGTTNTGALKFSGAATTTTATFNLNIGGSTSGAKQRVILTGANASLAAATAANQHAVTAGYFQIQNNNGLGDAATTTAWWVGATNAGTVTTGAALELSGSITTPNTKNINLHGTGPNLDGALRSVSGSNTLQGAVSVPNVAGTRIQVDAGSLTLGTSLYPTINPANASTPLAFTAASGATLNQNRQLSANVGAVTVNNGGTGTVVFAAANSNTGVMDVQGGTVKFTNASAPGAGGNNFPANTTAMVAVSGYKATFSGTATFGTNGSAAKATIRIGT